MAGPLEPGRWVLIPTVGSVSQFLHPSNGRMRAPGCEVELATRAVQGTVSERGMGGTHCLAAARQSLVSGDPEQEGPCAHSWALCPPLWEGTWGRHTARSGVLEAQRCPGAARGQAWCAGVPWRAPLSCRVCCYGHRPAAVPAPGSRAQLPTVRGPIRPAAGRSDPMTFLRG